MAIPQRRTSQHQLGGFEERVVKIKDIREAERMLYAVDELNVQYMVPINTVSGTYRLPRIGEFWFMGKTRGQWQLKHMIAEDIKNQYYHHHRVEVESVEDGVATVVTTELKVERRFKIDTEIRRYKSYQDPQVGETWIVDNALGQYTFAAFVGEVAPPVTSFNGQTGDVTTNWSNLPGAPNISQVLGWTNVTTSSAWSGTVAVRVDNILGQHYATWRGDITRSSNSTQPMSSSIPVAARPSSNALTPVSLDSRGAGRATGRATFTPGGGLSVAAMESYGDGGNEGHAVVYLTGVRYWLRSD